MKTRSPIGIGSTLNMSARALAKTLALRYSIPIVFVGFSTWSHELPSLNVHSISISGSFIFFLVSLSLSFSSSRTYSRTRTAFWQRVPARLVEGLLPVRVKISVRKFRSVAASESAAKLDINLPRYPERYPTFSDPSLHPTSFWLCENCPLVPTKKKTTKVCRR